MKLSEFDFDLPPELIAQTPTVKRDESKLLLPAKHKKEIVKFYKIIDQLNAGDLLIFNDSKVLNAQLFLYKNNSKINVNLNKPVSYSDKSENCWLGFAKPGKKLKIGDEFDFDEHKILIKNKYDSGQIEFEFILKNIHIFDFLDIYGKIPLPQYIKRDRQSAEDLQRYQTIYSKKKGSVAASTAGLHFTDTLFEKIYKKNVEIEFVTLHVGAGTFLPVKTENINEHIMHSEWCSISENTAYKINKAKEEGRRVICVGTTAMRVLESCVQNSKVGAKTFETDIFITPGYDFQIVDALITNFHLPKSTLFMLVSAFAGFEEIQSIYQYAIEQKMRFFSYGDAMFLHKK